MTEYRVTFGQKYRRDPHPTYRKAHPDGWLTIVAPDEVAARNVAVSRLGRAWAFMYAPENWDPKWYPLGELDRIEVPS
jgi:hypothetical protein